MSTVPLDWMAQPMVDHSRPPPEPLPAVLVAYRPQNARSATAWGRRPWVKAYGTLAIALADRTRMALSGFVPVYRVLVRERAS